MQLTTHSIPSLMLALATAYHPNMSYGYTNHNYGHFSHSRSNSIQGPLYRPPHNILIVGATGVIGTYITRAIVDAHTQGHFGRICVYTSEKTIVEKVQDIAALESWGVEVWVGSLGDERRFKEACKGMSGVQKFSSLETVLTLLHRYRHRCFLRWSSCH